MKKITSITLHMTSEGQRASYTYSTIDENSGAIVSENNRDSMVVLDIPANQEALQAIAVINEFVSDRMSK